MSKPYFKSKNFKLFIGLIILATAFYIYSLFSVNTKYKDFKIINYKLQKVSYKLLVADTPEKWEKGLMFFRKLEGVDGMIFLFPDKQIRNFWNKNTQMDLKIEWISDDKVVGTSSLPSIEKSKEIINVSSNVPVDKVIELPE